MDGRFDARRRVDRLDGPRPAREKPFPPAGAATSRGETGPGAPVAKAKGHKVKLDLKIAGLTPSGCDVEIKPAHVGCKFRTRTEHVDRTGLLAVELDDVEVVNADHDCTFAITIRESGQTDRTWRRGLRINTAANLIQTLPCYLSSPSKIARADAEAAKMKR